MILKTVHVTSLACIRRKELISFLPLCFHAPQQPPVSQAFRRRHTRNDQTLARSPIQLVRCKRHHLFKDSKPLSHHSLTLSVYISVPAASNVYLLSIENKNHLTAVSSHHGVPTPPFMAAPPRPRLPVVPRCHGRRGQADRRADGVLGPEQGRGHPARGLRHRAVQHRGHLLPQRLRPRQILCHRTVQIIPIKCTN